ncbi:MAG: hypothetical protein IIB44_01825 [Candidatus Marinimicrobia bacterium]|nr:hypothetical protein [Candidatus Neomarinimicrobiota bacterium]
MQKLEIFFNWTWAILIKTRTAFEAIIFEFVHGIIAAFWVLFTLNNSYNFSQHNQANLTLGPKNA